MQCHHLWARWLRSAYNNETATLTCSPIHCTRWVVPTVHIRRGPLATQRQLTSSHTTAHLTDPRQQVRRCRPMTFREPHKCNQFNEGVITAGVSVPIQIPSQGSDIGTNYWPRLQWSSFFGLPTLGTLLGHSNNASLCTLKTNENSRKFPQVPEAHPPPQTCHPYRHA